MLIHSVYFWLTEDSKGTVNAEFEAALRELLKIEQIASGSFGPPAPTEARPVTDHSFDYALVLQFASQADHDTYQVHPDHDAFVDRWRATWDRVQVYDTAAK
jgi:hypothetical protein